MTECMYACDGMCYDKYNTWMMLLDDVYEYWMSNACVYPCNNHDRILMDACIPCLYVLCMWE